MKADLERLGWRVITVWECELRESERLSSWLDADLRQRQLTEEEIDIVKGELP